MAETQEPTVGVVLVNDLGLYRSQLFGPLTKLLLCPQRSSFLIGNRNYFYGGTTTVAPPKNPFPNNWRPPEYGKPFFLMSEGKVPAETMKVYNETYSQNGAFKRLADLGYLVVPDINMLCRHITSQNPLLQKRARLIMARDKVIIDMINMCLETEDDLTDKALCEDVVRRAFIALDHLRYIPIEHEINLDKAGLNRDYRQACSKGEESVYASIAKNVSEKLIKQGRACQSIPIPYQKGTEDEMIDAKTPVTKKVAHVTTPKDYFGTKLSDKPIFGIKDFKGMKFKPIYSKLSNRAVIYMTDEVKNDPRAPNLRSTMDPDLWEYMCYAQLDMAGKFEDTLAYRKDNGLPYNREVYLALQYFMLGMVRYSNFNFLIDFNELNRISLAEPEEARREMYTLIAAATQNINWTIIQNSNLKDTHPSLGRDLLLKTMNFTHAPEVKISDIDTYLLRYDFMRDKVLEGQSSTPWAPTPMEGLSAEKIKQSFSKIEKQCKSPESAKTSGFGDDHPLSIAMRGN